jgi:hypothetical protein
LIVKKLKIKLTNFLLFKKVLKILKKVLILVDLTQSL